MKHARGKRALAVLCALALSVSLFTPALASGPSDPSIHWLNLPLENSEGLTFTPAPFLRDWRDSAIPT